MANIKGKQLASNLAVTNVTASGNISASNASTGSFGALNISGKGTFGSQATTGDLLVSQYIKHTGNETTFINFTSNRIRFKAGDIGFLDMEKDASTPYPLTVNQGGNRVNFRVVDRNTDLLLKTDSEAFNVNLYHAGSERLSTQAGGINITGHISASGNISGSATGTGSFAHIIATSKVSGSSVSTGSFGRVEIGAGGIDTAGDITLDGDGGDIILKDGGTEFGRFSNILGGLTLKSGANNNAIIFSTDSNPKAIMGGVIESSHNIETSATIIGGNISGSATGTGSFAHITATSKVSGSSVSTGSFAHITATSKVSGSSVSTGSFGKLVVGDSIDLVEDQRIFFEADKNTYIETHASDSFRVVVNNRQMFLLDEDTGNRAIFGNGTKVFIGANNNRIPTASLHIGGDIWTSGSNGHITASGNISASGEVIASGTGSFGSITTTGDMNVAGRLAHTGDADTRILFTDDDINITVGNVNMVDFTQDTVSEVTFNEAGADVDFRIESAGDNKAVFIDASKNAIQLGTAATTHITASGNISASGNIMTSATASAAHILVTGIISGSQIEASGDVIAFSSSDRRFKDNLVVIEGSLDKIGKINGYEFDWNDKQSAYKGHDIGVVAQEIEEVLPEVVTTRGDGYKAVKYDKIVPLLIESIKELQKKVEDIEKNCDCLNK